VIVLAAVSLFTSALPRVGDPWAYEHDFNGALVSLAARNHLRFGIVTTHGLMHLGTTASGKGPFYLHHPPLVSWWTAAAFGVFGIFEATARLAACAWPVLTLLVVSFWLRKQGLPLAAAAAATSLAIFPLLRVFGRMLEPSGPALFFLALAATRLSSAARGNRRGLLILSAALFLACLSSWAGVLACPIVSLLMLLVPRGERRVLAIIAPILCAGVAILLLGALSISAVGFQELREDALSILRFRTGEGLPDSVSTPKWLRRVLWNRPVRHLTFLWLPGMAGALFFCARAIRRGTIREPVGAALLLLTATGLLHVLLFPVASWYHNYWHFLLTVPVAMGVGLLVDRIGKAPRAPRIAGILLFLCLFLTSLFRGDALVVKKQENALIDLESFRCFPALEEILEPGEELAVAFRTEYSLPHPAFLPQFLYYLDRPLRSVETPDQVRSLTTRWLLVPVLPGLENTEILDSLGNRRPAGIWGALRLFDLSRPVE